jgi:FkbM family methyltransferase
LEVPDYHETGYYKRTCFSGNELKTAADVNIRTPIKFLKLIAQVKNPWPLVCDRLGIRKPPYIVYFRNGLQLELRPGRGDLTAFRESWMQKDYTCHGQGLAKGDTVIDVGANIGCFSLFAAYQVGAMGRVIAVEPNGETYRQLQRNIALNNLQNVLTMPLAVTGQSGVVQLHRHSNALYSSLYQSVDGHANFDEIEEVPAVTFQQLLGGQGVERCNFLKLDCEGAEHEIIGGMSAETAARIDRIGMELHEVEGRDPNDLVRRLQGFGFKMHRRGALLHFSR